MLTIKPPIKVTAGSSIISLDDRFGKRMQANYQVLASSLSPESMLHHMRDKSDIYVEGDSMTSIVNVNQQMNRQKINIELINNVLNRILVAENQTLCYQDRTFIDMVLSRIGVTDVKQFMNTVIRMKEQTNQMEQLLVLYQQSGTILKKITQYNQQKEIEKETKEEQQKLPQKQDSWIYQNIFQRLQTDVIYQELEKYYNAMYHSNHFVDEREFEMSEQVLQARTLLLHQLKNENFQEEIRLEHKEINQYETGSGEVNEIERKNTTVIDLQKNVDERQSYYQEQISKSGDFIVTQANQESYDETNVLEYSMINSYEIGNMEQYEEKHELVQNEFIQAVLWNTIKNMITIRMQEINRQENVWYDIFHKMQHTVENTMNRFESYHKKPFISYAEADYYQTIIMEHNKNKIETMQQFLEEYQEISVEEGQTLLMQELQHYEEPQKEENVERTLQEQEIIKEQLQQINRVNVEKQEKLAKIVQEIKKEPRLTINKAKALADAKRIIEHPQEAVIEYLQKDTVVEHYEQERIRQLEQVMDKDIVKIFEQVEQYHKNPHKLPKQVLANEEALVYLMQESDRTEEVLEEMQILNRNYTKNVQNHVQEMIQNEDVYQKTVTNKVNYIQLQESEELTNMIANNVKEQLGNLSEQVYRKLEKRMDSEKRRRGM